VVHHDSKTAIAVEKAFIHSFSFVSGFGFGFGQTVTRAE